MQNSTRPVNIPYVFDLNNLKFRRQFVFSNKYFTNWQNWSRFELVNGTRKLFLSCHPDLEVTTAKNKLRIVLLGYLLDPFSPDSSNLQIVTKLSHCNALSEVLSLSNKYNGRYVMIVFENDRVILLNDPTASKQLYYLFDNTDFWIGSSPNIIGEHTVLKPTSNDSLLKYFNSDNYKNTSIGWFGNQTPFQNLNVLFPNHYLDVSAKKSTRFWPSKYLNPVTWEEARGNLSEILEGTLLSASRRYNLHVSLTGGWDSRLILSSMMKINKDMEYYTYYSRSNYEKNIADFRISKQIAKEYDLNYHVIDIDRVKIDHRFRSVFYGNNHFGRELFIPIFQELLRLGYHDSLNVIGIMGNEILRIWYRFHDQITAEKISRKLDLQDFPYVTNSIKSWLDETRELSIAYNVNQIDWFNWEHFIGNSAGISSSEQDIIRDELRVFNCRNFLTTFLSLKPKLRYKDNPLAYRKIIESNYIDLLKIPIESSNINFRTIKKVLRFCQLEQSADNVYQYMKFYRNKYLLPEL